MKNRKVSSLVTYLMAFLILIQSSPISVFAEEVITNPTPQISTTENTNPLVNANTTTLPSPESGTTATTETNTPEDEDEDDSILDLGDDQSDDDAVKDFTGVVRQSKPYTCGPASLATLRTQLGIETSESEVLEYIEELSEDKGVTLLSLKTSATQLGSNVLLKKWSSEQILSYIKETNDPVLIHDEKKDVGGHFSVIREYNDEKAIVELSDTEAGNIKYSVTDFEHIYTGSALIIYEDLSNALLADESTNLLDDDASQIWGKYVPVSLYKDDINGKIQKAERELNSCIKSASRINNSRSRSRAKDACYTNYNNEIKRISEYEKELIKKYTAPATPPVAPSEQSKQSLIKAKEEITKSYNKMKEIQKVIMDKMAELALLNVEYEKMNGKLVMAKADKDLLEKTYNTKKKTADSLEKELKNESFESGGTTFSLGAIGNQISAQSAKLNKLSAGLTKKLADLNGQIKNAEDKIASLSKQKTLAEKAIKKNNYSAEMRSWKDAMDYKKKKRKSYSYEESQYKKYLKLADREQDDLDSIINSLSKSENQLRSLKDQKKEASSEINEAEAALKKAEALKKLGEAEKERKAKLFRDVEKDLKTINDQISPKETVIKDLQPKIDNYYNTTTGKKALELKTQIDGLIKEIDNYKVRIVLNPLDETQKQYAYLGDANLKPVEMVLTASYTENIKNGLSLGISIIPYLGESFDVTTLIIGKDPITGEQLNEISKILTIAGLVSGIGSGKLAREGGEVAFKALAKELGMSFDDIVKIANEVAKEYSVKSLDDFVKVMDNFSFDSLLGKIRVKAGIVKGLWTAAQESTLVRVVDHSYLKHIVDQKEYGSLFKSTDEWKEYLKTVMQKPSDYFQGGGKTLYWDDRLGTIIVDNPVNPTAFKPMQGKDYFFEQIEKLK